jgi:hypothetical protein
MPNLDQTYSRERFIELWRLGYLDEAFAYAQDQVLGAPRFSRAHYSALNDIAVLQRFVQKINTRLFDYDRFFDYDRLVRCWNLSEFIGDARVQALNRQLKNYCQRLGFEPDPLPSKNVSGDDRHIVAYGKFDNFEPSLRNLLQFLSERIVDYRSYLETGKHPLLEWAPPNQKYWVFAAATRRAGYHYPHLHTNAWLVATYHLTVPE